MTVIADKNRRGLMGPNHVRRLARVESIVKDPLAFTDVEPTLDLDFTDIKGAPFTGNLVRATVGGYRMNNKGVLVPTVANEPVIDFDSAGKPIGTGFYGAYTNLLLRSEEFDDAAWTKTRASITANAAIAPDGNLTADKLVEDTTASSTHFVNRAATITGGGTYCRGIFLKAAEITQAQLQLWSAGTGTYTTNVDLTAGTAVENSAPNGGWTNGECGITALPNGWYFVWSKVTTVVADTAINYNIILRKAGSATYTGDGTSGLYIWGAQLTATAFPVPYVPTTSAAVARNADQFTIGGTDFSDFFNATEGTIFLDANVPRFPTSFPRVIQFDDGTSNNRHVLYYDVSIAKLVIGAYVANVSTAQFVSNVIAAGAAFKAVYSYKANSFNASINGSSFTADTSGSVPSGLIRLWTGFDEMTEHIRRLIYWPKALDAATLQRMTA